MRMRRKVTGRVTGTERRRAPADVCCWSSAKASHTTCGTLGAHIVLPRFESYCAYGECSALAKQGPQVTQSLKLPGLQPTHQPTYIQIRSGFFEPQSYPGYSHRRTLGFDDSVSTRQNEDTQYAAKDRKKAAAERGEKVKSRMWMLSLKDSPSKDSSDSE